MSLRASFRSLLSRDYMLFFRFRNRGTIHCNYTDWNRQENVEYNSECVCLNEEYKTRIGCLEGE